MAPANSTELATVGGRGSTSAGRSVAVRLGALATAVVALGSAVLSWDALSWGAAQLGVDGRLTWLYPVVVDGTIMVGTIAALALRGAERRVRAYVWTLLAARSVRLWSGTAPTRRAARRSTS